jgi:integrase
MFYRLKLYLRLLGIDEGETPHGIRGACAISLAVKGAATEDVMNHVGWSTESTYRRYNRVGRMMGKDSVGAIMAEAAKKNDAENVFLNLLGV